MINGVFGFGRPGLGLAGGVGCSLSVLGFCLDLLVGGFDCFDLGQKAWTGLRLGARVVT